MTPDSNSSAVFESAAIVNLSSSSSVAKRNGPRLAARVPLSFSVEIQAEVPDGHEPLCVLGRTRIVSCAGATIVLSCGQACFERFHLHQHVRFATSFGSAIEAVVNGLWGEPEVGPFAQFCLSLQIPAGNWNGD